MKTKKSKFSWQELVKKYPDEWVALVDYNQKDAEDIEGILLVHGPDKKRFHKEVGRLLPEYKDIAIRYTGELIKNPEIPIRWQISPINHKRTF